MRLGTVDVHARDGAAEPVVRYALNDAVLHQGAMARLIEIDAYCDGQFDRGVSRRRPDRRHADRIDRLQHGGGRADRRARPGRDDADADLRARADQPAARDRRATSTIRFELGADARGVILTVDGQWAHSFLPGDVVELTRGRAAADACSCRRRASST